MYEPASAMNSSSPTRAPIRPSRMYDHSSWSWWTCGGTRSRAATGCSTIEITPFVAVPGDLRDHPERTLHDDLAAGRLDEERVGRRSLGDRHLGLLICLHSAVQYHRIVAPATRFVNTFDAHGWSEEINPRDGPTRWAVGKSNSTRCGNGSPRPRSSCTRPSGRPRPRSARSRNGPASSATPSTTTSRT